MSAKGIQVLIEAGAETLEDLQMCYEEENLIKHIESSLSMIDLTKFLKAKSETKGLIMAVPEPSCSISGTRRMNSKDVPDKSKAQRQVEALTLELESTRQLLKTTADDLAVNQRLVQELMACPSGGTHERDTPDADIISWDAFDEQDLVCDICENSFPSHSMLRMHTCYLGGSGPERFGVEQFNYKIDDTIPNWDMLKVQYCRKYKLRTVDNVLGLFRSECVDYRVGIRTLVRSCPNPFVVSEESAFFRAQQRCRRGCTQDCVQRKCLTTGTCGKQYCATQLACHQAGVHLAKLFNEKKPADCDAVTFCDASVMVSERATDIPMWTQFSWIGASSECKFEQYNDSHGLVVSSPTFYGVPHEAIQAFSHFTHHHSNGSMLVVDCKGAYDAAKKTFTLTTPVVIRDGIYDGGTHGRWGIDKFFKAHICNDICRALNLSFVAPK